MSTSELMSTGILMGILHVLTGPDHLSALATLCGTSIHTEQRRDAFLLGVRWGIGHSLGLLVVGGLLIALEESSGEWIGMDPLLRTIFEGFVGAFMLTLGAYGLFRAEKNNRESVISQSQRHYPSTVVSLKSSDGKKKGKGKKRERRRSSISLDGIEGMQLVETGQSLKATLQQLDDDDISRCMEDVLETDSRSNYDDLSQALSIEDYLSDTNLESFFDTGGPSDKSFVTVPMKPKQQEQTPQSNLMTAASLVHKHTAPEHSIVDSRPTHMCFGMWKKFTLSTPGVLALAAGILHGVAGPAGVLGVIPAVQLKDAKLAITYLGTFCISSTLVMGAFAAFYGRLSEWLAGGPRGQGGNRVYMVEVGSALLSLSVGIIWLVLLGLGKLDEVFP